MFLDHCLGSLCFIPVIAGHYLVSLYGIEKCFGWDIKFLPMYSRDDRFIS